MDRIGLGLAGDPEHVGDREIGLDRPHPLADLVGLVRLEAVEGELVLLGKDRDGAYAQFVRRPEHADRDLGPVRDENLPDGHAFCPVPRCRQTSLSLVVRLRKQLFASARGRGLS